MKTTNFVKIDGAKFKELIEGASGKTLKEISLENGFSDAFLRMVVKSGKASPSAQAVAKLYGIEPSAYEIKEEPQPTEEAKQMSFEDLNYVDLPDSVKDAVRILVISAVTEALHEYFKDGALVVTPDKTTYKMPNEPIKPADFLKQLDGETTGKDKFEI